MFETAVVIGSAAFTFASYLGYRYFSEVTVFKYVDFSKVIPEEKKWRK